MKELEAKFNVSTEEYEKKIRVFYSARNLILFFALRFREFNTVLRIRVTV